MSKTKIGPTHTFIHKETQIKAQELTGVHEVWTPEGKMSGHAGDYLVTGIAGEQYIVKGAIMKHLYVRVD